MYVPSLFIPVVQSSSPHDTWGNHVPFPTHTAVFTITIEVEQLHIYVNWDEFEVELIMTLLSGSGEPEQLAGNQKIAYSYTLLLIT